MDCPQYMVVDHINHNTLDNRKSNLRIVPQKINLQNKSGAFKNSKSGIRGVCYHKASGKWYARVYVDRKEVFQKLFNTKEEAEKHVINAREKYHTV